MPHIHDKFDFTTSAYIIYEGKLLLLHHKKIDKWLQPGGHIELDEEPLEALWREIKEETGLDRKSLTIIEPGDFRRPAAADLRTTILPTPFDFNVHDFNATHRHIDIAYLLSSDTDKIVLEESGAHDIGWFTKNQLKSLLTAGDMFRHTYNYGCLAIDTAQSRA